MRMEDLNLLGEEMNCTCEQLSGLREKSDRLRNLGEQVIEYCKYLNNFTKRNVLLSKSNAKATFLIRLADFVASSYRKVDKNFLESLNNYNIYRLKDINYKMVDKMFRK